MADNSVTGSPFGDFGSLGAVQHYSNRIDGTYGSFQTPAGSLAYLQTKARVAGAPSPYTDLTKALVPAREALNVREMDFNQLLQRDLDDHRIATKLIPYILKPPVIALPGFFPPIVAMLLPFNAQQQPEENFPDPSEELINDANYFGMRFRSVSFGRAFRIQYLLGTDDQPAGMPIAVLRWNPDAAKLVIMDGQHRAMALLAIERTFNNSWHASQNGARYEPFYREEIRRLLEEGREEGLQLEPSKIELPVTICWIPETSVVRPRPHQVARKLFVDVNNTARPPSEARLILLSDTELINIFARELLNRLRTDEWKSHFPLYAVEYDNPKKANTTPRRWSVLTNLEILRQAVLRTVFGPPKLIKEMEHTLFGKPNWREMNPFMHRQLEVGRLFPRDFHDGLRPMERDRLGNTYFPVNDSSQLAKLLEAFYVRWGKGILRLLSSVEPWRAHLQAIKGRFDSWIPGDNIQTLAKDALFEGVGMFWALEDGHELWLQQKQEARQNRTSEPIQPDVSRAWTILQIEQYNLFRQTRARIFLGSDSAESIQMSDELYGSLNTYAAQIGLILAWLSIHDTNPEVDPHELANLIVNCLNRSLQTGPTNNRTRRLVLLHRNSSEDFKPFNVLPKLDTPFATYFRYFWLELLILLPENEAELGTITLNLDAVRRLRDEARQHYLRLLVSEASKIRQRDADLRDKAEAEQRRIASERAIVDVIEEQGQAHKFWFATPIAEAREKIRTALNRVTTANRPAGSVEPALISDPAQESTLITDPEDVGVVEDAG